ncbi:MAG: DUF465 domain-containing protein [Pseudomonadota bacterium]
MSLIDELERQERRQLLIKLEYEHSTLDHEVALLISSPGSDQLHVGRLKRRKLHVKDMIVKLKSSLLPDVPA